jgi:molybdopterin/thiamine biosynthesis adenylyltransferase
MSAVRKILIADDDLEKIEEDKNKWLPKGLETGGYIFGKIFPNGLAQVTHIIDGGPKARRTPISFSGDNEYATKVKEELRKGDPDVRLLGEYHVHPWKGLSHPSGGDINQLRKVKNARPWFVIFLQTEEDFLVWDLIKDDDSPKPWDWGRWVWDPSVLRPVPLQPINVKIENLLDRILKITKHELLIKKTVLIVGLGSGGSTIAKYLGCTGIGRIVLVDNEELEVANVIRHEGSIEDIGKSKVQVCKEIIESHNPFVVVETYSFDAVKEFRKLEELASQSDLIIGSSGSPKVNNLLNKISIERRIPAIYGGVYEKALGGYVLAVKPFETACYNCMFGIASQSYYVDKEAAQRYGLSEDELHQQQGLWIDISFPSLILSKMALALLEDKKLDYNLVLYDSALEIKKLYVNRRDDCAVCNEKEWIRKHQKVIPKKHSLRERFRRLVKWTT